MLTQPFQRFLSERLEFTDWQRKGDQGKVPIGREDVSQRITEEMVLSECGFTERFNPLIVGEVHAALDGELRLIGGLERFSERGVKAVGTDNDRGTRLAHSIYFTPADATYAPFLPAQVFDLRTLTEIPPWLARDVLGG